MQEDVWDWFEGPRDDVLTIESYEPYTAAGGDVLMVVVVVDADEYTLNQLTVGEYEKRGLGWLGPEYEHPRFHETPSREDESLRRVSDLPSSIDLTSGCSPVRSQGGIGSCTAFAIGPGAYDYELGSIYGDNGWDFSDAFNLSSPKWLYRNTGAGCGPTSGRSVSGVLNYLMVSGTSTELNCPYVDVCGSLCTSDDAYDDAELLRIDDYWCILYTFQHDITPIKEVLAYEERVVVTAMYVDDAFRFYTPGTVWNYTGPKIGGHAMCIVGYNDAISAFKVRNSWGSGWGMGGYVYIGYDTIANNRGASVYCYKLEGSYDPDVATRFLGAPSITITAPENGETVSGTTDFNADVTDNSGVALVEMYVDGVLKASFNSEPYEYSWATTDHHGGPHTLKVYAEDDSSTWNEESASATVKNHTITGIDPGSETTGAAVPVGGTYFLGDGGDSYNPPTDRAYFSGVSGWTEATVNDWQQTEIAVVVPDDAVTGPVKVVINGPEVVSGFDFFVLPHVDALNPDVQIVGGDITVEGTGFGASANEDSKVEIGGIGAEVVSWGNYAIEITVPAGVTQSELTVTTGAGTSNGVQFTPKPRITGIEPARTWLGQVITVTGTSFGGEPGESIVTFAGPVEASPEDIESWSDTEIVLFVPEGAERGDVVVTVNGVDSDGFFLLVILPPPALEGVGQY